MKLLSGFVIGIAYAGELSAGLRTFLTMHIGNVVLFLPEITGLNLHYISFNRILKKDLRMK